MHEAGQSSIIGGAGEQQRRSVAWNVEDVEEFVLRSLEEKIGKHEGVHVLEKRVFSPTKCRLVIGLGVGQLAQEGAESGRQTTTRVTVKNVKRHSIPLSRVFLWCLQDPLGCIEEYSVGEPTFEQVFLKFAEEQEVLEAKRNHLEALAKQATA